MIIHQTSYHLRKVLPREYADDKISMSLHALQALDFDTIAFRGVSGAIIAPVVAHLLRKELIVVRKPEEQFHGTALAEGHVAAQRYVIVDDFIDSGKTIIEIVARVHDFAPAAKLAGLCLYNTPEILHRPGDFYFEMFKTHEYGIVPNAPFLPRED